MNFSHSIFLTLQIRALQPGESTLSNLSKVLFKEAHNKPVLKR